MYVKDVLSDVLNTVYLETPGQNNRVPLERRNEVFLTQTEELDHRKVLLSSFEFYW